jgi:hypothetical protein
LTSGEQGSLCYSVGGAGTIAQIRSADGLVTTVLGSGPMLTNDRLADDGNAALSMDLLGAHPHVVWWIPTIEHQGGASLASLLPTWVGIAALQLFVVLAALAVYRGRRLGAVVPEPLPVTVRAAETTEGLGRLYRRGRARGRAASHLRAACIDRLTGPLGLARRAEPVDVVAAVAARSGDNPVEVHTLLYGAPPPGDAALVHLAGALDALERRVNRT